MAQLVNPDSKEITLIADGLKRKFDGKKTEEKLALIRDKMNKLVETGFRQPFLYDFLYGEKRVSLRTDLELLTDGEADMLEKCLLFYSIATKCGFECEFILLLHPANHDILMGATIGVKEGKKTHIIDPNNRPQNVLERFPPPPRTYSIEAFEKKFLLERRQTDPIKLISRERVLLQSTNGHEYWMYCPPTKKRIEIEIHSNNYGIYWPGTLKYTIYGIITRWLKTEYTIPGTKKKLGPGPLLKHTIIDHENKKAATSFNVDYEILKNPEEKEFKKLLEGYKVEFYEDDEKVEKIIRNYISDPRLVAALDRIVYLIGNQEDLTYG